MRVPSVKYPFFGVVFAGVYPFASSNKLSLFENWKRSLKRLGCFDELVHQGVVWVAVSVVIHVTFEEEGVALVLR